MTLLSRVLLQSTATRARTAAWRSCLKAYPTRGSSGVAALASCRFQSSNAAATPSKIHIHFATSTGTAQMFAHDLQNALVQEYGAATNVQVQDLGQTKSIDALDPAALHFFLVSTTGVGAFPGSAEAFVASLQEHKANNNKNNIQFGMFGLGNSAAHPNHYNVASKTLYEKLVAASATPWMPLTLGDDGDCIEDDYDTWQAAVLQKLQTGGSQDEPSVDDDTTATTTTDQGSSSATQAAVDEAAATPVPPFGKRLELVPAQVSPDETTRTDLLNVVPSFYHAETKRWKVTRQTSLSPQPMSNALHELQLELANPDSTATLEYTAGDHLIVYPCHPDYLVEAYLDHFDIDIQTAMHCTVEQTAAVAGLCEASAYPHPTGVSLYDTLRHLVDLQAPPTPRLARVLLGQDDIDYKEQVYVPRQSPLALLKQSKRKDVSLEDLLYQLPAMSPRYYSIASSPLVHPHTIYLTYRPVRFLTSLGHTQVGLCTSYFTKLEKGSTVMAYVNRNPSFRLPEDPSVPIILLAGGCGVAAVRSLVEELQARGHTNPTYIFLGFRNPADAAYIDVMKSIEPKLLDVAYSVSCANDETKCQLVSDRVHKHGELLYDLLERQGAYTYLCGGARTFGAAIQRELYSIYETVGQRSPEESKGALQALLDQGRYFEDLADP